MSRISCVSTVFLLFFFNILTAIENNHKNFCNHCSVYYDGCNVCSCRHGETVICTEMKCKDSQHKEYICKECEEGYIWNNNTKQCEQENVCPNHCQVYYDGCNECVCDINDNTMTCTKHVCFWKEATRCKKCEEGYVWNSNIQQCESEKTCPNFCQVYYDGCNDCTCNRNNDTMSCTKHVCFWKEAERCKKCDNGYEWNSNTMECEKKCFEGCDIWFDGCNDFECNHEGTVISKTQNTCKSYGNSYCKKCESNFEWNDCGSICTPTCLQPNPFCSLICAPRCQCPTTLPIYHNGKCIEKKDCILNDQTDSSEN